MAFALPSCWITVGLPPENFEAGILVDSPCGVCMSILVTLVLAWGSVAAALVFGIVGVTLYVKD